MSPEPKSRAPRLLWANSYCMLDTSSGASISIRQILLQLHKAGWEIDIVGATVFDDPKGIKGLGESWEAIDQAGEVIVTVNDAPLTHRLIKTQSTVRKEMRVSEADRLYALYIERLNKFCPDVVFFYGGTSTDFHIPLEARLRGVPSVAYLVNANYQSRRWCRDVDLIITDTKATANLYADRQGFRPVPVGKFIDPGKVIANRHERKHITLINPSWAKGAGIVALIAMALEDRRPDIHFEVVESRGNWNTVVKAVTKNLEGKAREHLRNVLVTENTGRISDVYSRSRIVLGLSQWWESGSRVLAEAMLNGIPAIVSNNGGSPEIVGDGGIVVDLPKECHEPPYTTLPKLDQLEPVIRLIEKVWDDEIIYLQLMSKALKQGVALHRIEQSTDRLIAALKPLTDRRAGDNDYARLLTALHKHALIEGAPVAVPVGGTATTPATPPKTGRRWPSGTPRICVLTLDSGEPQLHGCRAALERQSLPIARHEVITGLPNKEAHDTLYAFVMAQSDDFDIFVKLDADMVPRSADFTKGVAASFAAAPDLDHLVIPVHDWLSQSLIEGLHCFSRSANWPASPSERLFVDPDPVIPGVKYKITPSPDLLVDHMPVPTLAQAFYYGVHRGLKIMQTDRAADEGRRAFHLDIFQKIKAEYLRAKDRARLAALWGLVCALDDPLGHLDRKMGEVLYPGKYGQLASDPRHVRNLVLARLSGTIHPGAPPAGPAGASLLKIGASE